MRRAPLLGSAALVSTALVVAMLIPRHAFSQAGQRPAAHLPATNMSTDDRRGPRFGARAAPGFAFAVVADNPAAPGALPIGEKTCRSCHELETEHFGHTVHAVGLRAAAAANPKVPVCEACHGAGSEHARHPEQKGLIIGFSHDSATPVSVQAQTCLSCHEGGQREHWLGSVHQRNGLSCSDCHNPMVKASAEGSMSRRSINETCATCHADIRARFDRRSHMPLPEGAMSCADCHNPHGSLTQHLLKTDTVNETCYQCHAEKRGPFLFEHPPVRDNCLNCHLPHGSNQRTLLVAPVPFLCQQCHTQLRHPNDLLTAESLGNGSFPDERLMGRGCLTCHAQIHGSNNPSGAAFHE